MTCTVIRGGTVVDPVNGIDGVCDVLIEDGRIASVAGQIEPPADTDIMDASGKLVTPGLIDVHAHVYGPGNVVPADPNCGVGAGVTTLVDAGSADASCVDDLVDRVVSVTTSDVYVLLTNHAWPDGFDEVVPDAPVDTDVLLAAAMLHGPRFVGLKVALTPAIFAAYGLRALAAARELAEQTRTRVMLHVGDIGNPALDATASKVTSDALDMLAPGDILTHIYSPLTGGPLDENERVLPALHAAAARGVIMDAAIGDYGFGWQAAEQILAEGIRADTLSSDVELYSPATQRDGLMVENRRATGNRVVSELSLVEYMSYFLELGFSVREIVEMCTSKAARAVGLETVVGDLSPGRPADVAVLDLKGGRYAMADVNGDVRIGSHAFVPVKTFKNGVPHEPGQGPHDWGFEPPAVA